MRAQARQIGVPESTKAGLDGAYRQHPVAAYLAVSICRFVYQMYMLNVYRHLLLPTEINRTVVNLKTIGYGVAPEARCLKPAACCLHRRPLVGVSHARSCPVLEPFCGNLSPKLDKVYWKLTFEIPPQRTSGLIPDRCRTNVAHIRQSSPDSGLGLKAKVFKTYEVIPFLLDSGPTPQPVPFACRQERCPPR